MNITKKRAAAEWRLLLFLLGVGCAIVGALGYEVHNRFGPTRHYTLDSMAALPLLLAPLGAVLLLRSVWWALRALLSRRAIVLLGAATVLLVTGAVTVKVQLARIAWEKRRAHLVETAQTHERRGIALRKRNSQRLAATSTRPFTQRKRNGYGQ